MSSYAEIKINGQLLIEWKNTYKSWYFSKSEQIREKLNRRPHEYKFIGCRTSVQLMRNRLQFAGYDHKSLEQDFNDTISVWIDDLNEGLKYYRKLSPTRIGRYRAAKIKRIEDALALLKESSFEEWRAAFPHALSKYNELNKNGIEILDVKNPIDKLTSFMISPFNNLISEDSFGFCEALFPCMQMESYAILLLDMSNEDDICELDITDIVNDGWIDDFHGVTTRLFSSTRFYDHVSSSLSELSSLNREDERAILKRMIFSNVITAMETYLSDTMKRQVLSRQAVKRRFVESYSTFTNKSIKASTVFSYMESLDNDIAKEIDKISFHNIVTVKELYRNVLLCDFQKDSVAELVKVVEIRHNIVHRNGKTKDGSMVTISDDDVRDLIRLVRSVVRHIDKQILNGLLNTSSEQD